MNYPDGTIVKNFNVSAGRLIQLPCFGDQDEPPDGFRAMIFGGITFTDFNANQSGPDFTSGPGAVQIDATSIINGGMLSKIRSIAVSSVMAGDFASAWDLRLMLNSGWIVPCGNHLDAYEDSTSSEIFQQTSNAFCVTDFLSAVPIFGIWNNVGNMQGDPNYFGPFVSIVIANFKLSTAIYMPGSEGFL